MGTVFLEDFAKELGVSPETIREYARKQGLPLGTLTSPETGSRKVFVIREEQAAVIREALKPSVG